MRREKSRLSTKDKVVGELKQMDINLVEFKNETETACALIKGFWKAHNGYEQPVEESLADLGEWTKEGHKFYFIVSDEKYAGFIHLGSRGCNVEDIFVLPEFQGRGIGSEAIRKAEEIVREYSESLYIEAAARNEKAIRLYQKLGYNCLNTITIRKDFCPENFETVRKETMNGLEFEVKRYKG